MTAYITSDFSNFNVFQNSHSDKPLIYKISGTWGNHEGSILLWLSMISIYGFLYSFTSKSFDGFKNFSNPRAYFKDVSFKLDKFFDAVRPPYKGNIEKVLQQLMK